MNIEQLPRADEAERAVIGTILMDNRQLDECDLTDAEFYDPNCSTLFRFFRQMQAAGEAIDVTLIVGKLRESGEYERIGGATELKRMGEDAPSTANFTYYAAAVREAAIKRNVILAGNEISKAGYTQESATEAVEQAERVVFELAEHGTRDQAPRTAQDFMGSTVDLIDARIRGDAQGLSTGIADLDRHSGGLNPGDLVIEAGRTGMGKTALAVNITTYAAIDQGLPVLFCSLEMSAEEIGVRLASSIARVDGSKIQAGDITTDERSRIADAAALVAKSPLVIDDASTRTVTAIGSLARRQKRTSGLSLLVVDYLQLVSSERKRESRTVEVGEITRRLKALARELQVPLLCLAQLNRATEANQGRRPMLSNLRESGSIEQDANQVWFCHRPGYYDDSQPKNEAEIIVAKRRNGPPGTAKVHWFGEYTQFRDRAATRYDETEVSRVG